MTQKQLNCFREIREQAVSLTGLLGSRKDQSIILLKMVKLYDKNDPLIKALIQKAFKNHRTITPDYERELGFYLRALYTLISLYCQETSWL